ncbi:MAG: glycosyltransferase family 4 protein [Pseudomonadota bacterium]
MTLLPMAVDGVGPSHTCVSLLRGMQAAGTEVRLYANRNRHALGDLPHRVTIPRALSKLPYKPFAKRASAATEAAYLRALRPGDIAYLWPLTSLATIEAVAARGNPIFLEGINTRMSHARTVMDAVYAAEGLAPAHGITDARVAEEEAQLALAAGIFAPSPAVEEALEGSPLRAGGMLGASYGTAEPVQTALADPDRPLRFLFIGSLNLRKGAHMLLRAWAEAKIDGELVMAGYLEEAVGQRCADELALPSVRPLGFVRDVPALYRTADVFILPSFEEGDPLVTYEAAAHGLPIIASPAGAGRMGAETGCVDLIDPAECDSLVAALRRHAEDPAYRAQRAAAARTAVADYTWGKVAARRADALRRVT